MFENEGETDRNTEKQTTTKALRALTLITLIFVIVGVTVASLRPNSHANTSSTKSLVAVETNPDFDPASLAIVFSFVIASCNIINTAKSISASAPSAPYSFSFSVANHFEKIRLHTSMIRLGSQTHVDHTYPANIFDTTEDGGSFVGSSTKSEGFIRYDFYELNGGSSPLMYMDIYWYTMNIHGNEYAFRTRSEAENFQFQNYQICIFTSKDATLNNAESAMQYYADNWKTASDGVGVATNGRTNLRCARVTVQRTVTHYRARRAGGYQLIDIYVAKLSSRPSSPIRTGYSNCDVTLDATYNWNKAGQLEIQLHRYSR